MKSPSDRLINDFRPVKVPDIVRSDPQRTNPSFITKEELQAIQKDIEQIVVPSSVTKLQPNFGEKAHGKLKADEWKSLYTIYLPMTLTRLWAPLDSHRLHLKALLNLSLLVQIVISKTASKNGADLYDLTIENYLKLISVLYPGVKLVINHHLALHLSTFMRLHGPCRSHWAFPVERLIGKLQRIVKNAHIGKPTWISISILPSYRRYTENNGESIHLSVDSKGVGGSRPASRGTSQMAVTRRKTENF
jgi:hypothetical protein